MTDRGGDCAGAIGHAAISGLVGLQAVQHESVGAKRLVGVAHAFVAVGGGEHLHVQVSGGLRDDFPDVGQRLVVKSIINIVH